MLVNPHLVKKNKENRDNTPSKSDVKDALSIADMVKNGYYTFIKETSEVFMELRQVYKHLMSPGASSLPYAY